MPTILIATRNAHKVQEIQAILGKSESSLRAQSNQSVVGWTASENESRPLAVPSPLPSHGRGEGQGEVRVFKEPFQFLTLADFPAAPKVIEDANTFAGNATKKAVELARWLSEARHSSLVTCHFVLADDSGLEVDALNGAPGVHSARFAAMDATENAPDKDNNAKLLRLLKSVPADKYTARFRCVIALTPVLSKKTESASPVCYADELEMQTQLFDGACEGRIIFESRGANGFGYDPLFVPDGFDQTFAELGDDVKNKLSHRAKALEKLRTFFDSPKK